MHEYPGLKSQGNASAGEAFLREALRRAKPSYAKRFGGRSLDFMVSETIEENFHKHPKSVFHDWSIAGSFQVRAQAVS